MKFAGNVIRAIFICLKKDLTQRMVLNNSPRRPEGLQRLGVESGRGSCFSAPAFALAAALGGVSRGVKPAARPPKPRDKGTPVPGPRLCQRYSCPRWGKQTTTANVPVISHFYLIPAEAVPWGGRGGVTAPQARRERAAPRCGRIPRGARRRRGRRP